MVLHRGRSTGGRMAALKAVTCVTAEGLTVGGEFGGPRRSRLEESAPLGRYQTIPGTREQPYPRWAKPTVDLGHVVCRRRGRALYAVIPDRRTSCSRAGDEGVARDESVGIAPFRRDPQNVSRERADSGRIRQSDAEGTRSGPSRCNSIAFEILT